MVVESGVILPNSRNGGTEGTPGLDMELATFRNHHLNPIATFLLRYRDGRHYWLTWMCPSTLSRTLLWISQTALHA